MPRLCYLLDLHDDPELIAEYERRHRPDAVWPEIVASLRKAGIRELEIYRCGDRLAMLMDVDEDYSPAAKAAADAADPRVQAWEALMWKFQKPLPGAAPGEKWREAGRIFALSEASAAQQADVPETAPSPHPTNRRRKGMHVKFAPLPVCDQDRAKDFYVNELGCEVAVEKSYQDDGWRWIEVRLPDAETTLLFERRESDSPGDSPALVLIDPDLDATVASLKAHGVEILIEPREAPWDRGRRFAEFRDSEGNRIVVATR